MQETRVSRDVRDTWETEDSRKLWDMREIRDTRETGNSLKPRESRESGGDLGVKGDQGDGRETRTTQILTLVHCATGIQEGDTRGTVDYGSGLLHYNYASYCSVHLHTWCSLK